MFKVILAKIGISLFRYLPLKQIEAKLLESRHATKLVEGERTIEPDYWKQDSPAYSKPLDHKAGSKLGSRVFIMGF